MVANSEKPKIARCLSNFFRDFQFAVLVITAQITHTDQWNFVSAAWRSVRFNVHLTSPISV
jgi:hypothetical protein